MPVLRRPVETATVFAKFNPVEPTCPVNLVKTVTLAALRGLLPLWPDSPGTISCSSDADNAHAAAIQLQTSGR
jgi:hypothetical protein